MEKLYISKTKKIILTGCMLALYIVLDRVLTINTEIIKMNFALIAVMITAIFLRT